MIRKPIVAGQFYNDAPEELKEEIKKYINNVNKKERNVIGGISPHAGYYFSGQCAAYVYNSIKDSNADLFLILGFSHNGLPASTSLDDFETPLGIVKNDNEFGKRLIENGLKEDRKAHNYEHSIEVQLPFLQYIKKDFKFVPVFVDENYEKIADIIKKTIKEMDKKVVIIASSDFTHYGINYGYFPFSKNIKENLYKLDKGAIELITNNDVKGFIDYCEKTGATICGKYPIACLMKILNKKGKLLRYYTSGDIIDDYNSAVGYAGIVF